MTTTYQLRRSTPEEQGISSASVMNFVNAIEQAKLELHSLMLIRHGYVVAEGWWAPYREDRPHMLFSLSKSFTSTAIGFAVQEGLVSLDDAVVSFYPEYEKLYASNEHLVRMRVRHLLSMATGHAQDSTGRITDSEDWVKGFLSLPVEYEPGTHFVYNSGASYMLSAILHRVTGQTLLEYLKPRLFDPLGFRQAAWETCPKGISVGGWGLRS
ncbi:serine hydrolase domain-containing protein [Paenibacillus thermotolerans]|uniref:serine hydrolase domain-containing protein n=1 Tax=Paenibacillus thermotolerans TaxID=3027807 RepID=UPI002368BA47|nr:MULTISPECIES: serine hydrolase domain-containing protein [unclassified Paenibacillus]